MPHAGLPRQLLTKSVAPPPGFARPCISSLSAFDLPSTSTSTSNSTRQLPPRQLVRSLYWYSVDDNHRHSIWLFFDICFCWTASSQAIRFRQARQIASATTARRGKGSARSSTFAFSTQLFLINHAHHKTEPERLWLCRLLLRPFFTLVRLLLHNNPLKHKNA